jgi:hypothetical protein
LVSTATVFDFLVVSCFFLGASIAVGDFSAFFFELFCNGTEESDRDGERLHLGLFGGTGEPDFLMRKFSLDEESVVFLA